MTGPSSAAPDPHRTGKGAESLQTQTLKAAQWQRWLDSLCDLPSGPAALPPSARPPQAEPMDAYALSAYAEAMRSEEVDGELWETYADLELEGAADEAQAWEDIKAFYADRGYCLVRVVGDPGSEAEEWIFAPELLERLHIGSVL